LTISALNFFHKPVSKFGIAKHRIIKPSDRKKESETLTSESAQAPTYLARSAFETSVRSISGWVIF
jgi:hypothetical protein